MLSPQENPSEFLKLGCGYFIDGDAVSRGALKIAGTDKIENLIQVLNQVLDQEYPTLSADVKSGDTGARDYFSKFWMYYSSLNSPDVWIEAGIERSVLQTFHDLLKDCEIHHQENRNKRALDDEVRNSMKEAQRKNKRKVR